MTMRAQKLQSTVNILGGFQTFQEKARTVGSLNPQPTTDNSEADHTISLRAGYPVDFTFDHRRIKERFIGATTPALKPQWGTTISIAIGENMVKVGA